MTAMVEHGFRMFELTSGARRLSGLPRPRWRTHDLDVPHLRRDGVLVEIGVALRASGRKVLSVNVEVLGGRCVEVTEPGVVE
jgi:hypothetical protein